MSLLGIEPHNELMEEEVKTSKMEIQVIIAKPKVGTKPLVIIHVETKETIVEEIDI